MDETHLSVFHSVSNRAHPTQRMYSAYREDRLWVEGSGTVCAAHTHTTSRLPTLGARQTGQFRADREFRQRREKRGHVCIYIQIP